MRNVLLLAMLVLSGCLSPRVMRYDNAPHYEPTNPSDLKVLDAVPEGAILLGEVDGIGTTGLVIGPEAMDKALEGAAAMGADAVVVIGHGSEPMINDPFGRDFATVRVKALRLVR